MTTRELFNAYVRGHHIVQLKGRADHTLLMVPVLLGCYRDIYYKHIRGTEKTSSQRKLSAQVRDAMKDLIGREYWGMTADETGALGDYIDAAADKLGYSVMGLQRANYNFYEGYEDSRREVISWCATAHNMAYVISSMRELCFVKVRNIDIEIDRQRINSKYALLDKGIMLYANTFDNRPDELFGPDRIEGVKEATQTFINAVFDFIKQDIDKEI